jgi:hypothetical protein
MRWQQRPHLEAEQAHDEERAGVGALAGHGAGLQVAVQISVRLDAQLALTPPDLPQYRCSAWVDMSIS